MTPGVSSAPPRAYNPRHSATGWGRRAERNEAVNVEEEEDFTADADEEDEPEEANLEAQSDDDSADASLDEILTKKPEERPAPDEEEDEESILSLGRDDRVETLSVKVEPKKDTEFVCRNCHLVKPIRSQLADKKRMFCRDCV
jgi:hypothetical protein